MTKQSESFSIHPAPVETGAIVAMVATTGIDMGLKTGIRVLAAVGGFGGVACVLAHNSARGGWFAAGTMLGGVLTGVVYLGYRRYGQLAIAHKLIERFGAARFHAAQPVIDEGSRFLSES
jgi:hypothetical protein